MLFKRILLPIDINDADSWKKPLPTCVSILKSNPEAQLWLLSIVPNFGLGIVEEYFPKGWMKDISAKTLTALQEIVKANIPDELSPKLLVGRGVVYQAILDHVTQLDIDLIVMSASHPHRKDYLLGPNVARVARHADVSVLIRR